jgi:transposase-like protein
MTDHTWRQHAACIGMDVNEFFPDKGEKTLKAKQACAGCPVAQQCTADARTPRSYVNYGVWGGELYNHGRIVPPGGGRPKGPAVVHVAGGRYPAEVREKALAMYQQIRPEHQSDKAACRVVAEALGIHAPTSVQSWVCKALDPNRRQVGQRDRENAERRLRGLEMLHRIRGQHATEYGAYAAVAHAIGVHTLTVRDWANNAREQQREQLGKAA